MHADSNVTNQLAAAEQLKSKNLHPSNYHDQRGRKRSASQSSSLANQSSRCNKKHAMYPITDITDPQESDGVFVNGVEQLIGTHIRSTSISMSTLDDKGRYVVKLCLNNIVDITDFSDSSQLSTFTPDQLVELQDKVKVGVESLGKEAWQDDQDKEFFKNLREKKAASRSLCILSDKIETRI
ncbi:hypothetical protein DFQ30_006517 [Apophysomyces sp. BC1015]|nr:hypothetical protein DFQ30_006517 [Apophysomyces sp. BC1015]KAG0176893.1 hypothetical protein DFQ29_005484 [Apophysomyces sp. BC1021]